MAATRLVRFPVHLGLGATAEVEPAFSGDPAWYQDYSAEVVLCTSGAITLHQERADGSVASVTLEPGEYAINEPGTWHTADVTGSATALFITAGIGTEIRPR